MVRSEPVMVTGSRSDQAIGVRTICVSLRDMQVSKVAGVGKLAELGEWVHDSV